LHLQAKDDNQAKYLAELLKKKIDEMEIDVNNTEVQRIERQEFGSLECETIINNQNK